uniref:Uncharacterized protein n=1 Tax=Haptolina ericina TaxID=156174 RepID=A0A7S3AD69_9EUKA|mmetsp:Transcript_12768/g.29109  ORF Transcript_12768/g.29109 Transcript_12768/m.29109 type:complete len:298 (+) Transcript_12768:20-913(+)|eukprot:CAMPEP_0181204062 /NCGR_PEP_ID=MMETSP1096-20121128/19732_1 /TAXON_ID=156174 ORGANISM="Chrysochromulina ericina, Strain CCMP281" /NCGR_SAMPLE_ID=MMETSP1096 /ASSEMBLY_ACC=CAM_ASM_000453 /LENGTH=297 /DNA_ID=CAMNT_0023294731 /DNA_START=19 /DNA_END=912 /DNA_ORIENTATION=+
MAALLVFPITGDSPLHAPRPQRGYASLFATSSYQSVSLVHGVYHARTCTPQSALLEPDALEINAPDTDLGAVLRSLAVRSRSIPCPFFRRRAGDAVEAALVVARFIAARHKSLAVFDAVLPVASMGAKTPGLPLEVLMQMVARDIEHGQYYVSGRLSQAIYSDSCIFDGPDPDMPVRSLQRYTDALRGLFDPRLSTIELLSIDPTGPAEFVAHWRLSGALKLPWRPPIKPYFGATRYEVGPDGLINSHTESWSISALDAFASMLIPRFGEPPAPSAATLISRGRDHFVEPPPRQLVP